MSDNRMIGPGAHEIAAQQDLQADRTEDAQVRALLAIASAVNRLASAVEDLAAAR